MNRKESKESKYNVGKDCKRYSVSPADFNRKYTLVERLIHGVSWFTVLIIVAILLHFILTLQLV